MEKAKVYYSDLRTSPTSNLLDKMERLLKRAGIEQLPLKDSFAAIKIHLKIDLSTIILYKWKHLQNFILCLSAT